MEQQGLHHQHAPGPDLARHYRPLSAGGGCSFRRHLAPFVRARHDLQETIIGAALVEMQPDGD